MLNDPLFPLLLALRYVHILSAIALMGSTIFMRVALVPSVAELGDDTRKELHKKVRGRWAKFVHLAVAGLLVSGIINMGLASRYAFEGPNYNMLVGIKLILALPIFFIASMLAGRSAGAEKFQANQKMWLNINVTLAIVMVLMGGFLRAIPRKLKGDAPAAVTQPEASETK